MNSGKGGQLAFQGFLKASGKLQGEREKDQLASWSTRTNVSTYSSNTLIGNWNEQRFDVSEVARAKGLPSQYDHYYETAYRQAYSPTHPAVPGVLKFNRGGKTEVTAFPAHQPILDPPQLKQHYNSFMTSSMEAYSTSATQCQTGPKVEEEEESGGAPSSSHSPTEQQSMSTGGESP